MSLAIAVLEDRGRAWLCVSSKNKKDDNAGYSIFPRKRGDVLVTWVNLTPDERRRLPFNTLCDEDDSERGIKEFLECLKDMYRKRRQHWSAEILIITADRLWRIADRFAVIAETHPHSAIGEGACEAERAMCESERRNVLPVRSMLAHALASTWDDEEPRWTMIKKIPLR